jgi:hypothetical protein
MSDVATPITGRCLCGGVTYTADAAPFVQGVCHCTDCQRQTGNPFSVIVGVPGAALHVDGETLAQYSTTSESGGPNERNFCSACGSPLFSRVGEVAYIKAGSLDDASWVTPTVEVYTASGHDWAPTFEGTVRLERGPQ